MAQTTTTIGFVRNTCSRYVSAAARVETVQSEEYEKPIFGDVCHPPLIFLAEYLRRDWDHVRCRESILSRCFARSTISKYSSLASRQMPIGLFMQRGPESCNEVYFNLAQHYRASPSILITQYLYSFDNCEREGKKLINFNLKFISKLIPHLYRIYERERKLYIYLKY